jgi:hypothetical protein
MNAHEETMHLLESIKEGFDAVLESNRRLGAKIKAQETQINTLISSNEELLAELDRHPFARHDMPRFSTVMEIQGEPALLRSICRLCGMPDGMDHKTDCPLIK